MEDDTSTFLDKIKQSGVELPNEVIQKIEDASGIEQRVSIINQYRKQQIIDMVCRQTTLTPDDAEYFLRHTRGDMVSAIRLFMNGETRETLTRQKAFEINRKPVSTHINAPKTVNQQIYYELRNFMDISHYKNT